jgi:hypothetical protein
LLQQLYLVSRLHVLTSELQLLNLAFPLLPTPTLPLLSCLCPRPILPPSKRPKGPPNPKQNDSYTHYYFPDDCFPCILVEDYRIPKKYISGLELLKNLKKKK